MSITRRAGLALTVTAMVALAACTGDPADPGSPSSDTVALAGPSETPVVVADGSLATVSAAASRGLVEASPVVVLAEPDTAKEALGAATDLGVPLLLVDAADAAPSATAADGAETSSGTGTTGTESSPGTATDTTGPAAIAEEVERLGATSVVALGPAAEQAAASIDGVDVATSVRGAAKVTKADGATTTALLTTTAVPAADAEQVDPLAVASTGTGTAIGATVISTPAGDARQTADSVTRISEVKPTRVVAVGSSFGTPDEVSMQVEAAATGVQLPGGGQLISPGKVYIALYGHPGTPSLGVLGEQGLDGAVDRTRQFAEPYEEYTDSEVIPTFEIITTVATNGAGPDGDHSNEVDPEFFRPWIERAQAEGVYVILDLQPGTDDTLEQAKRYESLLKYPNVGLAIDPEWKLKPGQRHLAQIGSVDAAEVNSVLDWLAELTAANDLPQKAVVLHQFQLRMITNRAEVTTTHPELQLIVHVDGHGDPGAKRDTYAVLTRDAPAGIEWGWKNFIDEDSPTFTPKQTMEVSPTPTMVSYQ